MSKLKAYAYTSSAIKFGDTMILTWSNLFSNSANYGVKDSWKHLIITNQGNEWQNVILVKEQCFPCLNPDYCFKTINSSSPKHQRLTRPPSSVGGIYINNNSRLYDL